MADAVGGIIGGVGSIVGGAMGSDAASDAASAQERAANQANATAKEQYEKNTKNLQPYMDAGGNALTALMYRLGIGNGLGASGKELSEQEIRNELRNQFTSGGGAAGGRPPSLEELGYGAGLGLGRAGALQNAKGNSTWTYDPDRGEWGYRVDGYGPGAAPGLTWIGAPNWNPGPGTVDEAGLEAAVQDRLRQQQEAKNNPLYGSLLKEYAAYRPFSEADFKADPGYQFRLDQGNKALQNLAAATGNLNSGRALKDAMSFNSGTAAQEYQNAYARYNNDYLTGFNTGETNKNNIFNKLMGMTGLGQSSASALANVGQNYSGQVANNLAQGANAQAAGIVGSNNAISQGIGGVANALGGYFANNAANRGSGYSGTFQPTAGVGGLGSGQGVNGWW